MISDKENFLELIKTKLREGLINKNDLEKLLSDSANGKVFRVSNVISFIGFILLFLGLSLWISAFWSSFNSFVKVLVSLSFALFFVVLGLYLSIKKKNIYTGNALNIVGAITLISSTSYSLYEISGIFIDIKVLFLTFILIYSSLYYLTKLKTFIVIILFFGINLIYHLMYSVLMSFGLSDQSNLIIQYFIPTIVLVISFISRLGLPKEFNGFLRGISCLVIYLSLFSEVYIYSNFLEYIIIRILISFVGLGIAVLFKSRTILIYSFIFFIVYTGIFFQNIYSGTVYIYPLLFGFSLLFLPKILPNIVNFIKKKF